MSLDDIKKYKGSVEDIVPVSPVPALGFPELYQVTLLAPLFA